MVYFVFRSPDGTKTFEMGCLINLSQENEDVIRHVIEQIHKWSPEKRWQQFFAEDNTPKCVIFIYQGFRVSAAWCKLPHFVPEIFCLIQNEDSSSPQPTVSDIEELAIQKTYSTSVMELLETAEK